MQKGPSAAVMPVVT